MVSIWYMLQISQLVQIWSSSLPYPAPYGFTCQFQLPVTIICVVTLMWYDLVRGLLIDEKVDAWRVLTKGKEVDNVMPYSEVSN